MAARNMQITEINIHEKELCVKLVIYKHVYAVKYDFFRVFPRRLSANSRRFGTLYRFHLQRQVKEE
jgi:hypothetical protein